MSTNEQTLLSQPKSVVRNTLGKEPVLQDLGRPIFDEALREYCDRNYHRILPIIAEKVHQEKAQQEKLKAVKSRLNFEETSHHSETGTPIRRRGLKERLRPRYVRSRFGSLELRCGALSHLRKRVQKGKRCSKGWKKVYSTSSETREKVCPYTQTTKGVGRTIVATGTLKAATKALDQEQQNPLLRDVITKGNP
ncbi:hypothetical protein Tco_0285083 [Tanacetum coccineum]